MIKFYLYFKSKTNHSNEVERQRLETPTEKESNNLINELMIELDNFGEAIELEAKDYLIDSIWDYRDGKGYSIKIQDSIDNFEKKILSVNFNESKINTKTLFNSTKNNILGLSIHNNDDVYYFYITAVKTIKKPKRLLISGGSNTFSIITINNGIDIPEEPVAKYSKKDNILKVFNPTRFAKLFQLNSIVESKAYEIFDNITKGKLVIDNHNMCLSEGEKIKEYIFNRPRLMKKLAHIGNIDFNGINLDELKKLSMEYEEIQKKKGYKKYIDSFEINNDKKMIEISIDNIKNFIDVCSDSMYKYLLSQNKDIM